MRPEFQQINAVVSDDLAQVTDKVIREAVYKDAGDAEEVPEPAKTLKEWLDGAIALRYADRAATLRRQQGKDTGTVRFADGDVTVVADLPKKAEWDQAQLATLIERIRAGGDDPAEYVEISYRVPERKYAAWPARIREAFASARKVRTGKPTFTLKTHGGSPLKTSGGAARALKSRAGFAFGTEVFAPPYRSNSIAIE